MLIFQILAINNINPWKLKLNNKSPISLRNTLQYFYNNSYYILNYLYFDQFRLNFYNIMITRYAINLNIHLFSARK